METMKKYERLEKRLENLFKNGRTIEGGLVKDRLDKIDTSNIWLANEWYGLQKGKYIIGGYKDSNTHFDFDSIELYYFLKKEKMLYLYDIIDGYNDYLLNKKNYSSKKKLENLIKIKKMILNTQNDGVINKDYLYNDLLFCLDCEYRLDDLYKVDNDFYFVRLGQ